MKSERCETTDFHIYKIGGHTHHRSCPTHRGARLVEKHAVCPVCGQSEIINPMSNTWKRCTECQRLVTIARRRVHGQTRTARRGGDLRQPAVAPARKPSPPAATRPAGTWRAYRERRSAARRR